VKLSAALFVCDEQNCQARITIPRFDRDDRDDRDTVAVYLDLVEKGWAVHRNVAGPWKHACPEHSNV
jgi:hypothetical protein